MSELFITRAYYSDCTVGRLFIKNSKFYCPTLELPWLGNEPNISCIDEGDYTYRIAPSPARNRDVIWIDKVQGRSAIQIHEGNYTSQIRGCILVGDGMRDMNGDTIPDVTNSLVTLQKLMANISSTGTLKIRLATKAFGVYK
jgi:hypothetical protein